MAGEHRMFHGYALQPLFEFDSDGNACIEGVQSRPLRAATGPRRVGFLSECYCRNDL